MKNIANIMKQLHRKMKELKSEVAEKISEINQIVEKMARQRYNKKEKQNKNYSNNLKTLLSMADVIMEQVQLCRHYIVKCLDEKITDEDCKKDEDKFKEFDQSDSVISTVSTNPSSSKTSSKEETKVVENIMNIKSIGEERKKEEFNDQKSKCLKRALVDNSYKHAPSLKKLKNKKELKPNSVFSGKQDNDDKKSIRTFPASVLAVPENKKTVNVDAVKEKPLEILDMHQYFCDDFDLKTLNSSLDTIIHIETVEKLAKTLEHKVSNFSGTQHSLEFFILDEKLMRLIEHLDTLKCKGDQTTMKRKIEVITYIKNLQAVLDSRATDG